MRKEFIEIDADSLEEYILGVGTIYLKSYQIIEGKRADPDSFVFTLDRSKAKNSNKTLLKGDKLKCILG